MSNADVPESSLDSPEDLIAAIRGGQMVVLADDEGRENEGDVIMAASAITPEAVNFMARFARGLICLALESAQVERLGLPLMPRRGPPGLGTAFTVSIEAREGVTTGISAADRARTVSVVVDPSSRPEDIVTPGHVFPLVAREGGVLVRAGHTEATVDLARLAGLPAAGVLCEVMREDGTMARMPDLCVFARTHGLKLGTIADLIAYRRCTQKLVARTASRPFTDAHGGVFTLYVYRNLVDGTDSFALVKGDVAQEEGPVPLVRVQTVDVVRDVLGPLEANADSSGLAATLAALATAERGVLVLVGGVILSEEKGLAAGPLRDTGIGAQILRDLGVRRMILLTHAPRTLVGLEGHGLVVVEQRLLGGS